MLDGVGARYKPPDLAEFTYGFNRRRSPPDLVGWVTRRLMGGEPTTLLAIRGY